MKRDTKALIQATCCVLLWSFIAVIAKAGQHRLDSFQFLFWSNLLSVLAIFVTMQLMGHRGAGVFAVPRRTLWQAGVLGVLDCLFYLFLYRGYAIENGVAVLVAQYSWPLLVVGLSVLVFREWLHWRQTLGMVIGFLAVAMVLSKGHLAAAAHIHAPALAWVMAGALCFALLSVLSRKFDFDAYAGTFWLFVSSTLCSMAMVGLSSHFVVPSGAALWSVLINGTVINGVSYILWVKAMSAGQAPKLAALVFLAPILSVLWMVLFYGEAFVPAYVMGVGLSVVSGLLCISRPPKAMQAG